METAARTPPEGLYFIPVADDPPAAVRPAAARRLRGGRVWDVLLIIDIVLLGFGVLFALFTYIAGLIDPTLLPDTATSPEATRTALLVANVVNLLMLGVIPFLWVAGTREKPWTGAIHYLHLERPWPAVAHGAGYAALLVGLVLWAALAVDALGLMPETSADDRFLGIDWPLALLTALVAGVAEEVFFRGVLQRFVGVWWQAGIFGLAHIGGGPIAFVVTAGIGLLFGLLVARGRSLWLVIAAHFLYDLVLLGAAVIGGEFAAPEALL